MYIHLHQLLTPPVQPPGFMTACCIWSKGLWEYGSSPPGCFPLQPNRLGLCCVGVDPEPGQFVLVVLGAGLLRQASPRNCCRGGQPSRPTMAATRSPSPPADLFCLCLCVRPSPQGPACSAALGPAPIALVSPLKEFNRSICWASQATLAERIPPASSRSDPGHEHSSCRARLLRL